MEARPPSHQTLGDDQVVVRKKPQVWRTWTPSTYSEGPLRAPFPLGLDQLSSQAPNRACFCPIRVCHLKALGMNV